MVMCVGTKAIALVTLVMVIAAMMSCAGHSSSIGQPPTANIAGAWEFIATSQTGSNTGVVTGIEVAMSEGQVLVSGLNQPNGQISANSNQISFISLAPSTLNISEFGGPCQSTPGTNGLSGNSLTGSVTAPDAPMQFTFTENGNVFTVNGTLGGDGKSLATGTYTAQADNACTADSGGTITGNLVANIVGTFLGKMCALGDTTSPCQPVDSATAAAAENSSNNLTLNLTLTGTDNTSVSLSGPVTGNAFNLYGTVQGQIVTYEGYYEVINGVSSLYLVNATNAAAPNYVGTLAVRH